MYEELLDALALVEANATGDPIGSREIMSVYFRRDEEGLVTLAGTLAGVAVHFAVLHAAERGETLHELFQEYRDNIMREEANEDV
jgi:hypothetical protein